MPLNYTPVSYTHLDVYKRQESSSLVICIPHLLHFIPTVAQCFHCCILAVGRCAHDRILMDLQHLVHNDLWSAYKAKSPSCHGKSFGEAIDNQCSLFHTRQRCYRSMSAFIGQFAIYLIRNHIQIMFFYHFRNRLQFFSCLLYTS